MRENLMCCIVFSALFVLPAQVPAGAATLASPAPKTCAGVPAWQQAAAKPIRPGPTDSYLWCSNFTVTGTASALPPDTCCDRAHTSASNQCLGSSGHDCCSFGSCTWRNPVSQGCYVVGSILCATDGDSCSSDGECCGGHCLCGSCSGGCQAQSNSCWSDCECCSHSCDLGQHQCN